MRGQNRIDGNRSAVYSQWFRCSAPGCQDGAILPIAGTLRYWCRDHTDSPAPHTQAPTKPTKDYRNRKHHILEGRRKELRDLGFDAREAIAISVDEFGRAINRALNAGATSAEIATMAGVSRQRIYEIARRTKRPKRSRLSLFEQFTGSAQDAARPIAVEIAVEIAVSEKRLERRLSLFSDLELLAELDRRQANRRIATAADGA